jgi:uncharacterized OB-fold protein
VTPSKPLPVADADGRPFWEACRRHELRAQRCSGCGKFRWPPRGVCPACHSWDFVWLLLPGSGVVDSFVVVHRAPPAFAADAPYVVAYIELAGTNSQVKLLSNVVDCPWQEVHVGLPVQVVFEDVSPDVSLPKFRL